MFRGTKCFFVNVYSSCMLSKKRRLWGRLIELRGLWGGEWCVGGNFNSVRFESQHIGRYSVFSS